MSSVLYYSMYPTSLETSEMRFIVCDKLIIHNKKVIRYKWPIVYDMICISVYTLADSSSNYSSLSGEVLCFCLIMV